MSCSPTCVPAASTSEDLNHARKDQARVVRRHGHFYTTTKNKRTTPDKIEIKKYDPKARKHVMYKETKIK